MFCFGNVKLFSTTIRICKDCKHFKVCGTLNIKKFTKERFCNNEETEGHFWYNTFMFCRCCNKLIKNDNYIKNVLLEAGVSEKNISSYRNKISGVLERLK